MSRLKKTKFVTCYDNKESDICKILIDKTDCQNHYLIRGMHHFKKSPYYNLDEETIKTMKLLNNDILIDSEGHTPKYCCVEEENGGSLGVFKHIGLWNWASHLLYSTKWFYKI